MRRAVDCLVVTNQPSKTPRKNTIQTMLKVLKKIATTPLKIVCHCKFNSEQKETNETTSVAGGGLSD